MRDLLKKYADEFILSFKSVKNNASVVGEAVAFNTLQYCNVEIEAHVNQYFPN